MIKKNSVNPVWGFSLGSTSWAAACVDSESSELVRQCTSGSNTSAPSLLLPRLSNEPARLDIWDPVHVRGSGVSWPPEGIINNVVGSGRMPVAAAWTARNQPFFSNETAITDNTWRWNIDGVSQELRPVDCIAEIMAQMSDLIGRDSPITLTIPNNFRQSEQQLVIDRCRSLNVNATLLWSPIAAALAWLDRFESTLKSLAESKRHLLYVHVDWGTISFTEMQIRDDEVSSREWLPARSRPQKTDLTPGFGWVVEANSRNAMPLTQRWDLLLAAGAFNDLCGTRHSDAPTLLKLIQKWDTAFVSSFEQLDSFREKLINESRRYAGIVITGDFADFLFDGDSTLRSTLDLYAPEISTTSIIAPGIEGEKLLAKGATIFASE